MDEAGLADQRPVSFSRLDLSGTAATTDGATAAVSTGDISVIICAYTENRWQDLLDSVESVRRQHRPPREIIVVVDHNERLLARVRGVFSDIVVVENTESRGLSGARNSGIAVAQGTIVAFLDDDATAAPDWLVHLASGYQDPSVIGVGGMIEPVWLGGRPSWFPDEFNWVVGCTYRGMPEVRAPVRNLLGANMSLRREVFKTIGGFRSGIGRVGTRPVGCEETELCIRARQRWPQAVFLYQPQARVLHRVPASRAQWRYFQSRCYAEGLSKALVARCVGPGDGLASEKTHALRTLPEGVLREVREAIRRRNGSGWSRAGSMIAGLGVTASGYVVGTCSSWWTPLPQR